MSNGLVAVAPAPALGPFATATLDGRSDNDVLQRQRGHYAGREFLNLAAEIMKFVRVEQGLGHAAGMRMEVLFVKAVERLEFVLVQLHQPGAVSRGQLVVTVVGETF